MALLRLSAVVVGQQSGCSDDLDFAGIPVADNRMEHCSWIDLDPFDTDHRRAVHCAPDNNNKQEIREKCPRACGICCGDNTRYRFPAKLDGSSISAACNWLAEQSWRVGEYCNIEGGDPQKDLNVEVPCPHSCGNCPTPSPVPLPDAPTSAPTQEPSILASALPSIDTFVPGTGGAGSGSGGGSGGGAGSGSGGGSGGGPGSGPSPSPAEATLFFAGDLYSDQKVLSSEAGNIMSGVNTFFAQKGHKIFTDLKKNGIQGITFVSLQINEGISDFNGLNALCANTQITGECNPMVGSFKVDYVPNSPQNRNIRRLEDSNAALIGTLDGIMQKFPGALTANVDGLNGIFIRNMASDMDSLEDIAVGDTPHSLEGNENLRQGGNVAKIVAPVVVCVLLVGFIIMAYVVHRRRQNQIIVELEETMDSEDEVMMSPLRLKNRRTKVVQTEQMKFPVDSGESSNYLPGFDCMCGDPSLSTSKD
eukprot:CAMPEP_0203714274 /NCGR_PEP_ID=MMETSP0091-20130426/70992_1 /ASSEMBLY_ACC=CAM_ASM_001089 /TAXON_ID=426623 /ORGANISM="Chaetoceros affinis, Strain CCMP159" /LENGTH=476 /DNA_ID=CAMNT_0050592323 /DNA_START=97 /DNA_END=1527 /DNA_ORIENTATION=+